MNNHTYKHYIISFSQNIRKCLAFVHLRTVNIPYGNFVHIFLIMASSPTTCNKA